MMVLKGGGGVLKILKNQPSFFFLFFFTFYIKGGDRSISKYIFFCFYFVFLFFCFSLFFIFFVTCFPFLDLLFTYIMIWRRLIIFVFNFSPFSWYSFFFNSKRICLKKKQKQYFKMVLYSPFILKCIKRQNET